MWKRLIITVIVTLAIIIGAIYAFSDKRYSSAPVATQKIKIVASFYPLADFAHNVGGDLVDVINITPAGAEPHDYEPTPQDIAKAYNAKLFIYNGNGVDVWADKIRSDLEAKGVMTIKMSDEVQSINNDPHFWLDPVNAQTETDVIAAALTKIDPSHAADYTKNRDNFKKQLDDLDQQYKTGLATCQTREIVTSHDAFNYLAKRYNLISLYILGLSPDAEPSPKTIADVSQEARAKNIKYIFFETLVSPKVAETVAKEIGAQILVLNPIEGLTDTEINHGWNYISIMKDNLTNLRTALQCH
jgi:zinc transport system substrate-binding protein